MQLQAEDGIGIPEEIFDQPSFGTSIKSYLVFIQFDFLWTLNYFALVLLNFLEVRVAFLLFYLLLYFGLQKISSCGYRSGVSETFMV